MTKKQTEAPAVPQRPRQLSIRFDDETLDWLDREAMLLSARPPFVNVSLADIIRAAIREYRATHAPAAKPLPVKRCTSVESTGGSYCTACFARALPGQVIKCLDGESVLE